MGSQAMVVLGQACRGGPRKIRRGVLTRGAMPAGLTAGESLHPCLQEKPLGRMLVPVPRTDTGGQVENTKVIEITIVKELGKMAP